MDNDAFDGLEEWGECLDRLAEIERSGRIDQHQEGLTRLLRYRDNWRLREAALKSAAALESPSDEVLAETSRIAADGDVSIEERLLAFQTLTRLAERAYARAGGSPDKVVAVIRERMGVLLTEPCAPILEEAKRACLAACGATEQGIRQVHDMPEPGLNTEGAER